MNPVTLGVRVAEADSTGRKLVRVAGEMDLANAHVLGTALEALAHQPIVELDLRDLTYMDSSGLSVLVIFRKQQQAHGGRMLVSGLQPSVARLFDLAGMEMLFEIAPEAPDAT